MLKASDLLPEEWRHDCQGKQDYDCDLVGLSCRYYPPAYRADGRHSAVASIIWGVGIGPAMSTRNFDADTQSEIKAMVEAWARKEVTKLIQMWGGSRCPDAYAVYGYTEEYGHVLLPDYVGPMNVIRERVMEKARREGYLGTFEDRMKELDWSIRPLFSHPPEDLDA